ncbi:MAG: winged helix-turn-helix transcriptional regulator [Vallitaleaceae bacterium]|nr:winged helix-turn-helix transcriptional regulator [Vallitaleaceae bacterium]
MEKYPNEPNSPIVISKWISILYRQFQIYFNQHLKSEGISSSEYIFLMALYLENDLSQDTLSQRLFIDKAATARSIKKLEEKHYITRQKDLHDKRINRVHITESGLALRDKIIPVLDSWNKLLTDDLPPAVIKDLSQNLESLTHKVRQINFDNKEKLNE